jgi:NADPH:quinone reductase-like Zn-dependent oxidoreductase
MKAIVINDHGGPEVLELVELPDPEPGCGEVRVRVRAVALNHLDLWIRRGGPAFKHLEYPHRLGSDIAGEVDAVGDGVSGWSPGDKVVVAPGVSCGACQACASGRDNLCRRYRILGENTQGGSAELAVVPAVNLLPYPGDLSFPEAAASLLSFLTAWQMVVRKARVRPGQTVLVHGAGSGVGSAAIQIARLHGAEVITTASTDAKLERARELGAAHTINYESEDFVARVKEITGKRGVDAVVEHVGGEILARSILATRNGGAVVTCGATAGFKSEIDLRHVFFRQVQILGSTMGPRGDLFEILEHIGAGRMRPIVHATLPLAEAAEAHRILEDREAFGKVVLEI